MDWRDLARGQAGVITRAQLSECGVLESVIRRRIAQRDLTVLLPHVYAARPAPDSFTQRVWAGVLWSGGIISHRTAARLWGLPVPPSKSIHLTVAPTVRRTAPGLVLHRVRPADRSTLADGLPVTTRLQTTVDLLRTEPFAIARSLLDRGVQQGWIENRDLQRAVHDEPGRTGNSQLRRLLASVEPGADAQSERVLHRLLKRAGLTGWVAQYRLRLASGFAFVDVAFPDHRLAIEVDGRRYHDARSDAFESDRIRQNQLQLLGWRVLRFTWAALRDRPQNVIASIAAALT